MAESEQVAKDTQRGKKKSSLLSSIVDRVTQGVGSFRKNHVTGTVPPPKNIGRGIRGKVEWLLKPAPFGISIPWKRQKDAEEYGEMLMRTQNIEPPSIIRREITEEGLVYDEREVKNLATKS